MKNSHYLWIIIAFSPKIPKNRTGGSNLPPVLYVFEYAFWQNRSLLHCVKPDSELGLFVCRAVFMNQIFCRGVVNSLDGDLIGTDGCIFIARCDCCVKLLDVGLKLSFHRFVPGVLLFCKGVSLGRRFNVGHWLPPPPIIVASLNRSADVHFNT